MSFSKYRRLISIQLRYAYLCLSCRSSRYDSNSATCIIFSRDRAMQLEALLMSIQHYAVSPFDIIVQYSCSLPHEQTYECLKKRYTQVRFVREATVSTTLKQILRQLRTKYMFFLVDDQVFIRPFDVRQTLPFVDRRNFFSMRLGKSITNWGIRDIPVKGLYTEMAGLLHWTFSANHDRHDWGYRFSVDGHVYRTIDILRCTLSIPFKAPNSYEANMNSVILFKWAKGCTAFSYPVVVNLIINASRQESEYEQCEGGEYSADDLLRLYQQGRLLDLDKIASIPYNSAHHIVKDIRIILK